jgi:hypothetical protein
MLEGAPDGTPSEGELAHAVVRLRKRFQTVKERLLDLGRQQGLIDTRAPKRASSVRP